MKIKEEARFWDVRLAGATRLTNAHVQPVAAAGRTD